MLAVAQWLFHDQKFERLELRTAADNTASQQVAQKIGCISEGVLRNAWIARSRTEDGGWTDIRTDLIVWSLLPEDLDGVPGRTGRRERIRLPRVELTHAPAPVRTSRGTLGLPRTCATRADQRTTAALPPAGGRPAAEPAR